jgi:hypothetical protein
MVRRRPDRLSRTRRNDLADALTGLDGVVNVAAVEGPFALAMVKYSARREAAQQMPPKKVLHRKLLARAKSAQRLASLMKGNDGLLADAELSEAINERGRHWNSVASEIKPEAHKPANDALAHLLAEAIWILVRHGVPLTLRPDEHRDDVIEVIQLVRQWADEIDGRQPRERRNGRALARTAINAYRALYADPLS